VEMLAAIERIEGRVKQMPILMDAHRKGVDGGYEQVSLIAFKGLL